MSAMERPGTNAEGYEDYQRDIERFQQRQRGPLIALPGS